jgi:hypothetical protein
MLPAVDFVRHESLQHRGGTGRLSFEAVLDRAGERRDVPEAGLGQMPHDLDIRIFARLEAPVDLQKQRLAVDQRRVALIARQVARRQIFAARQAAQVGRRLSAQAAALGGELRPSGDHVEHGACGVLVGGAIEQIPLARARQPADHCMWRQPHRIGA